MAIGSVALFEELTAWSESPGGQAVLGSGLLSLGCQEEAPTQHSGHCPWALREERAGWCHQCKKGLCRAGQWKFCLSLNPSQATSRVGGLGLVINKCKPQFPHL